MDFMACWLAFYKNSWEVLKKLSYGDQAPLLSPIPNPFISPFYLFYIISPYFYFISSFITEKVTLSYTFTKNGTPFTYMFLVNNFSFLITRSSRLMVQ